MDRLTKKAELVRSVDIVMPEHINNHGTLYGGRLIDLMDKTAAITALKYALQPVVTASIDSIDLHRPIRAGNILEIEGKVIYTGKTSLVIKIRVYASPRTGGKTELVTTGRIVFVAVDSNGEPSQIPALEIATEAERKEWQEGEAIKQAFLDRKNRI